MRVDIQVVAADRQCHTGAGVVHDHVAERWRVDGKGDRVSRGSGLSVEDHIGARHRDAPPFHADALAFQVPVPGFVMLLFAALPVQMSSAKYAGVRGDARRGQRRLRRRRQLPRAAERGGADAAASRRRHRRRSPAPSAR